MGFSFDAPLEVPFGEPNLSPSEAAVYRDLLGEDLFFDGELKLAAKGDYRTIAGEENYRRGILRRLITTPGTYRLRPDYGAGLGDAVKGKLTKGTLDALTARIREQVAADRRTEKVISVTVTPLSTSTTTGPLAGVQGIRVHVVVQAFGRVLRPLAYRFAREG
jgi:phage baseplate assembly protein W